MFCKSKEVLICLAFLTYSSIYMVFKYKPNIYGKGRRNTILNEGNNVSVQITVSNVLYYPNIFLFFIIFLNVNLV